MEANKINEMLNDGYLVEGIMKNYQQYIDKDQIADDGVCEYEAYRLDGIYVSKSDMQAAVDLW